MAKSRWFITRQTITIAATVVLALFVSYSVILDAAVFTAINLCCYPSAEKENLSTDSCCAGIGTNPDCCCYYIEVSQQNETLLSYESFSESVYSYLCNIHTFDNSNLTELYSVDCETQCSSKYIVYKIFRPPKVRINNLVL